MTYNSIRPGQVWLDTEGKRIHAHGGSIITVGDTFYWYGENKEKTTPGGDIWHWGVRCYASKDLYNWEDKGIIIPPNLDDVNSPLHPTACMDRPHILYNQQTKKYVCWLKIMHGKNKQTEMVLTAQHVLGPYTVVQEELRPLGMNAGDFDLAVDSTDGKAYYYFERVHSELICADLTQDYTTVSGYYSTHFPNVQPPFVREAPAHFYRQGTHYLFTSGTTGYYPNPSEVACAKTWHGPWTALGNPHRGDTSRCSFNSQISSVFKHPGKKDLYIALADRWIYNWPELAGAAYADGSAYEQIEDIFYHMFHPELEVVPENYSIPFEPQSIDTSLATYVWLPVRFEGDVPYLDWRDEWTIEEYE